MAVDVSNRNRVAAGVPTGGEFATEAKGENPDLEVAHQTLVDPIFAGMEREERVAAMHAEIDAAVRNMEMDPEALAEFLDWSRKFHRYSFGNQMLIHLQCPRAERVAGKSTWEDAGGSIKKGAKAIWIWAPRTYVKKEVDPATGQEVEKKQMYFVSVPVYDISDIDGVELPKNPWGSERLTGDAPAEMKENLTSFIEKDLNFTVEYVPLGPSKNGDSSPFGVIRINSDMDPRQQALTLAHEAAHVALGHMEDLDNYHTGEGGNRRQFEVEADSVAYIIGREFGIDDAGKKSFGYIAGWAEGDTKLLTSTASKVQKTAHAMLDKIRPEQPLPVDPAKVAEREKRQAEYRAKKGSARKTTTRRTTTRRKAAA